MRDGDISNETQPRSVVVFEGLLGRVQEDLVKKEKAFAKMHRYAQAARCWEFDTIVLAWVWDMTWRYHVPIDVATYLNPKYAAAIRQRIEEIPIFFSNFYVTEPDRFARELAHMPFVQTVYFALPTRPFIYGGKGQYIERSFNTAMRP